MSDFKENRSGPLKVCLLGSEGAGKTCFIAGLALLSEPNRKSSITVTHCDSETANYFDDLRETLRNQDWPPPTTKTTLLSLRANIDGNVLDLKLVDYAGEDFRGALRKLEKERIEELYNHFRQADAILLLFDPHCDLVKSTDRAERENQIERQLAHLQAIAEIWQERCGKKAGRQKRVDVGIILTKADTVPELVDSHRALRFFREHALGLYQKIRPQAHAVKCFPLSAVGAVEEEPDSSKAAGAVPARDLHPQGYEEIFRWILKRKLWTKRLPLITVGAALVVLLLLTGAAWTGTQKFTEDRMIVILNDPDRPVLEKLKETADTHSPKVRKKRTELYQNELAKYGRSLQTTTTIELLAEIQTNLRVLEETGVPENLGDRILELRKQAASQKEQFQFANVERAFTTNDAAFLELAWAFLDDFPGSGSRGEIEEWLQQRSTRDQENAWTHVCSIPIDNAVTLARKGAALSEYVQKYGQNIDKNEKPRMQRAAELAQQFKTPHYYTIRLKNFGGLTKPRHQAVRLFVGGDEQRTFKSPQKVRDVNWPQEESFSIQWKAGQPILIVLEVGYGALWTSMQQAASVLDDSPVALRLLQGSQRFSQVKNGWEIICEHPFVRFEVDGIPSEDWKAMADYIHPGNKR